MSRAKVDNALQRLDTEANLRFSDIYNDIRNDLKGIDVLSGVAPYSDRVRRSFRDRKFRERVEKAVLDASLKATSISLGDKLALASADKYISYQLHTSYRGLKLSDTLRDNARQAETIITGTIQQELRSGTNWRKLSKLIRKTDKVQDVSSIIADLAHYGKRILVDETDLKLLNAKISKARRYLNTLKPSDAPTKTLRNAYEEVLGVVESRKTHLVDKALNKAFEQKIRYNCDRIARTELTRAYDQAFQARIEDDPQIKGFEWQLSANHPIEDICDVYADLDTGNGAGIYRNDDFPNLPANPNCMCMKLPVVDSVLNKCTWKKAEEHLDKMSDRKRALLIGKGNSMYKSKYREGLKKHGFDISKPQQKRLPKYLLKEVQDV